MEANKIASILFFTTNRYDQGVQKKPEKQLTSTKNKELIATPKGGC